MSFWRLFSWRSYAIVTRWRGDLVGPN
jgi:hypothetical protein